MCLKNLTGRVVWKRTRQSRLWTEEPDEALRTVALLLAFPSACAKACRPAAGAALTGEGTPAAASGGGGRLRMDAVLDSLIQTRQWAALRQLLRASPFGGSTPTPTSAHELRVRAVRRMLQAGGHGAQVS